MRHTTICCVIATAGAVATTSHADLLDITGTATIDTVVNGSMLPGDLNQVSIGDSFSFAARWNNETDNAVPVDAVTTSHQNTVVGAYDIENELSEPIFTGDFTDGSIDVTNAFPEIPRGVVEENDEIVFTFVDEIDDDVVDYSFALSGDADIFDSQDIPVGITAVEFSDGLFSFAGSFGNGTGSIDSFDITLVPAPSAATIAGIGLMGLTRRSRR